MYLFALAQSLLLLIYHTRNVAVFICSIKEGPFVKYAGLVSSCIFRPVFDYLDRHLGALLSVKPMVSAW